jgi:hypothetical protein
VARPQLQLLVLELPDVEPDDDVDAQDDDQEPDADDEGLEAISSLRRAWLSWLSALGLRLER